MKKTAIALAVSALVLTACSGVNHDAPNPSQDIQTQRWVRLETPPSFATIMFTCFGTTGVYMDQDGGNTNEIPSDPMCPISRVFDPAIQAKYGFRIVQRTNSNGAGTS